MLAPLRDVSAATDAVEERQRQPLPQRRKVGVGFLARAADDDILRPAAGCGEQHLDRRHARVAGCRNESDVEHWRGIASAASAAFAVEVIDPGRSVVVARLADAVTGVLSPSCSAVVDRWYGS